MKYEPFIALALLLKSHTLELFAVVTGILKARWTVRKLAAVASQIWRGEIKEGALPQRGGHAVIGLVLDGQVAFAIALGPFTD